MLKYICIQGNILTNDTSIMIQRITKIYFKNFATHIDTSTLSIEGITYKSGNWKCLAEPLPGIFPQNISRNFFSNICRFNNFQEYTRVKFKNMRMEIRLHCMLYVFLLSVIQNISFAENTTVGFCCLQENARPDRQMNALPKVNKCT